MVDQNPVTLNAEPTNALWNIEQLAAFLHVSQSWIRRHLQELPHSRHGRLIRFDPVQIRRTVEDRKPLRPTRRLMPTNRYQQGGVYRRGKGRVWYGTFRLDGAEGRRSINVRLGTSRELPTKADARRKLREEISRLINQGEPAEQDRSFTYAELVDMWKQNEGPGLGEATRKHYENAVNAYVLPHWKKRKIDTIHRVDVTTLLNAKAMRFSRSSLRSMRLVMRLTLEWAERNGYIQRPNGWLDGIKLPRKTGGRKVIRTELNQEQTLALIDQLKEPYASLVLFLGLCGRRIEEAIGLQPGDLDDNNILHIRRIIYDGKIEELAEEQLLPLDQPQHAELVRRLRALGKGQEWIFHSRRGTPLNPGNARRRYLKPAALAAGIQMGGWHDFRHTLIRKMRRGGVHPVVISAIVGHKRVELAPEVYDRATLDDKRHALAVVGSELLPNLLPSG